jgi:hypothetical protein
MTTFFNSRTLIAGAFVAAATISVLSFGSSAQASTTLSSCEGPSAKKVIDCCQKMTRISRPFWMRDSGSSCHTATVCKGGNGIVIGAAAKRYCYIRPIFADNETHGRSKQGRSKRR